MYRAVYSHVTSERLPHAEAGAATAQGQLILNVRDMREGQVIQQTGSLEESHGRRASAVEANAERCLQRAVSYACLVGGRTLLTIYTSITSAKPTCRRIA